VYRPEIVPKHFDKLKPEPGPSPARNPAPPEKRGPTYNSDVVISFLSLNRKLYANRLEKNDAKYLNKK